MKTSWFYLKLLLIGLTNSFMIIVLAGVVSTLFGVKHIIFFGKLIQEYNIPYFVTKILFTIYDFIIMSIATIPILFATYILMHSNIKEKWRSISMVTSFSIFLFAYFAPFLSMLLFGGLLSVYSDLFGLIVTILLNIYIIFKLSKKQLSAAYKPYAILFLIAIYTYLIGLNLKIYGYPI